MGMGQVRPNPSIPRKTGLIHIHSASKVYINFFFIYRYHIINVLYM